MRIAELSERTGLSAATIKYYVREGLLPGGLRVGYNSTDYDESYVARIRLIRALTETGGLPIAAVREVVQAVDDPDVPMGYVLGTAQRAAAPRSLSSSDEAMAQVDDLLAEHGWEVGDDNHGRAMVAGVLSEFARVGRDDVSELLRRYAAAADLIAEADLAAVAASDGRGGAAETVVLGMALGDVLLSGLRRIAQESLSRRLHPVPDDDLRRDPSS